MALYEMTFLTRDETDAGVKQLLEEVGATISEESSLGRKRLVYPIQKETQAVYTTYVFDAPASALGELNRKLRLNSAVLRYLILSKKLAQPNKEVSKAVREAIEAAEKLEDVTDEMRQEVVAPTVEVVEPELTETTEEAAVEPPVETEVSEEPKPKKRAAKKTPTKEETPAAPADAAEATEEDRLKALEDKLGEILKD